MFEAFKRLGVPPGRDGARARVRLGELPAARPRRACTSSAWSSIRSRAESPGPSIPRHDIRIENFRDTRLPEGSVDAVIGNPPFADVKLEHNGMRFSLHDYFFAKSLDALRPGGVLALVTTHYTLDKQNAPGARVPRGPGRFPGGDSAAVGRLRPRRDEGRDRHRVPQETRGRRAGTATSDASWLEVSPLAIEGVEVPINRYFSRPPRDGAWAPGAGRTGSTGASRAIASPRPARSKTQLRAAVGRLPELRPRERPGLGRSGKPRPSRRRPWSGTSPRGVSSSGTTARPSTRSSTGRPEPVVYGGTRLKANGTMTGKRLAALIRIRDAARLVLQSPERGLARGAPRGGPPRAKPPLRRLRPAVRAHQQDDLLRVADRHDHPADAEPGEVHRGPGRHARHGPRRLRPDLGHGGQSGHHDAGTWSAGPRRSPRSRRAEEGLLVSLDQKGRGGPCASSRRSTGPTRPASSRSWATSSTRTPRPGRWQTADDYLSGNVREKLAIAEAAGPEYARNAEALRAVQPEDVLPGEIDANLGAPWVPESDIQAFAAELFGVPASSIAIGHLKKDALWSVEAGYDAA